VLVMHYNLVVRHLSFSPATLQFVQLYALCLGFSILQSCRESLELLVGPVNLKSLANHRIVANSLWKKQITAGIAVSVYNPNHILNLISQPDERV
jgi:hypothetical protein